MTRAGNYSGSLCLSLGVFARICVLECRNFDDLPLDGY
uniref:Uncharacterized protein n=1 Tax=Podoviridae sp. cthVG1 TaxID=2827297 RepID=A0A8S5RAM2_9CAUD|nr:MAG TPA: hypothetical protein [Podoviridae sp. cthVG1]